MHYKECQQIRACISAEDWKKTKTIVCPQNVKTCFMDIPFHHPKMDSIFLCEVPWIPPGEEEFHIDQHAMIGFSIKFFITHFCCLSSFLGKEKINEWIQIGFFGQKAREWVCTMESDRSKLPLDITHVLACVCCDDFHILSIKSSSFLGRKKAVFI